MKRSLATLLLLCVFIGGCGLATTRPKEEMSLAAAAFLAAKEAKAHVLAPTLYKKAETLYLKAKANYRKKYFNRAKQFALKSQQFSERAEYLAIKKASLEGEGAQ